MNSLKMALAFVRDKVNEKRAELVNLEKQVSRERFQVRYAKNQVSSFQDAISAPGQGGSDMM